LTGVGSILACWQAVSRIVDRARKLESDCRTCRRRGTLKFTSSSSLSRRAHLTYWRSVVHSVRAARLRDDRTVVHRRLCRDEHG